MKILKFVLLGIGVIALAVALWFFFQSWLEVRNLWSIANANRSNWSANPTNLTVLSLALGLGAGLLLGIGIGMPTRTAASVRRQALQDAADVREAAIRKRVGDGSGGAGSTGSTGKEGVPGGDQ